MFRLTRMMRQLVRPTPVRPRPRPPKPVVIWNVTRRCNLRWRHCDTTSADMAFAGELTTEQALDVVDDLGAFGVPALILSGGEPLSRDDFFVIAERARQRVPLLALSTNGTRLVGRTAERVAGIGFDYIGISLDGIGRLNDWFRGQEGAYDAALDGVRACVRRSLRVGMRFTLTSHNAEQLPDLLDLADREGVDKFYLDHPVYAGRGNKNRGDDAERLRSRRAMDILIDRAWVAVAEDMPLDIVTGNNDADAVYLLQWAERRFPPERLAALRLHLEAWGGNASGVGVGNIDPQGRVHPDAYWSVYTIGNVKERPFSALWTGDDPMLAELRRRPRPLKGRCGACALQSICGGNTRIRALQLTGDPWAEDPACYMTDGEIGLAPQAWRLELRPFTGKRHDPADRYR